MANPSVQIETVARLERNLTLARRRAAAALRQARERKGLSLREVSPHVDVSHAALSMLERGMTWQTETARRLNEFYRSESTASVAA